ncbi:sorbosone dehydrogenase family protein [Telmatocola sphagniphila]|uniref:Sorbosone dehydrogenase family protein n=2 Tax=Telmatocola sphagniphila TaxID=1123043 RepID=A0A8E6BAV3_9BACT|nr:sorbosone dehydrogenase family protein [Telmatocola sphagniphila]
MLVLLFAQQPPSLPKPFATPSVTKHPKVIGWPEGKMPKAPEGFEVSLFADKLDSPRWITVLPNGDILVAEARTPPKKQAPEKVKEGMKQSKAAGESANRITLLRPSPDGKSVQSRHIFMKDLNNPFGMALIKNTLYIGCMDAVVRVAYTEGLTEIREKPMEVHALPTGGYNNHWTRNVVPNVEGTKLFVTVGSGSNVGEHGTQNEILRANILEMNLDGTELRVYAWGLRNPVGLAWEPQTRKLWTVVNERDELGDELVPDYLTQVKAGGFYGWPYSYFGANEDPRRKGERPDLIAKALTPDYSLGSHTASLGLTFCTSDHFPKHYSQGAFIGQHGSWNRSQFVGYRVAFVPFKEGHPSGQAEDFLTGFIANEDEVYGRPVGVTFAKDGALLVADDASNCIWRVAAK